MPRKGTGVGDEKAGPSGGGWRWWGVGRAAGPAEEVRGASALSLETAVIVVIVLHYPLLFAGDSLLLTRDGCYVIQTHCRQAETRTQYKLIPAR